MHGFVKRFADGIFDPEDAKILTQAFDDAWAKVLASNALYAADEYAKVGRTIIAKHIINAAMVGERDPRWLADSALLYLSEQKLRQIPPEAI
jgi:hypothetical protein